MKFAQQFVLPISLPIVHVNMSHSGGDRYGEDVVFMPDGNDGVVNHLCLLPLVIDLGRCIRPNEMR